MPTVVLEALMLITLSETHSIWSEKIAYFWHIFRPARREFDFTVMHIAPSSSPDFIELLAHMACSPLIRLRFGTVVFCSPGFGLLAHFARLMEIRLLVTNTVAMHTELQSYCIALMDTMALSGAYCKHLQKNPYCKLHWCTPCSIHCC